jgi:hypothetical protein
MIGRYHSLRGSPLTWPPVQKKKNLADLDVRTSRVVYCVASSKQTCLPDHLLDFFCAACINLTIHRSLPRWNAVNPRSKTAPRCWPRMGDVRRKWEAYATVSSDINDTGTDRWSYAAPTCTCRLFWPTNDTIERASSSSLAAEFGYAADRSAKLRPIIV